MSEFENLKDKAEQYAQQHPEQVEKGEDAIERKLGLGDQDNQDQGGPQDKQDGDQQPG